MDGETLRQLADRLGVTRQTVHNWVRYGVRRGGRVIRLRAEMLGGRWRVTEADLAAFRRDVTAAAAFPADVPAADGTAAARALEELRGMGCDV